MTTLLDLIRTEFALPARAMTPAGRGARGEIWRLHLDDAPDLAVKLLAAEPSVALEVAHTRAMSQHGVRVAANIPDRHGHYVIPAPGGWLRISEWITGATPDPADPRTPSLLGDVLGRMHANTTPTALSYSDWYRQPPDLETFERLIAAADPRWEAFLPTLRGLCDITRPPASLLLCHRDLHPDNVLLTPDGKFAVLDWDNLGPADPTQELASVLLHWFADHTTAQGHLIRPFLAAYRSAGGTGALTSIDDFAMHIATCLNFLALQLGSPTDPRSIAEIEESLRLLPTPAVLRDCLEIVVVPDDRRCS